MFQRSSGISRSTCILRCRRNKECLLAAIDESDCLFLSNGASVNVSTDKGVLKITILKEIDTKEEPKIPQSKMSSNFMFRYC